MHLLLSEVLSKFGVVPPVEDQERGRRSSRATDPMASGLRRSGGRLYSSMQTHCDLYNYVFPGPAKRVPAVFSLSPPGGKAVLVKRYRGCRNFRCQKMVEGVVLEENDHYGKDAPGSTCQEALISFPL